MNYKNILKKLIKKHKEEKSESSLNYAHLKDLFEELETKKDFFEQEIDNINSSYEMKCEEYSLVENKNKELENLVESLEQDLKELHEDYYKLREDFESYKNIVQEHYTEHVI